MSIKEREAQCFTHQDVREHGQYLYQLLARKKIGSYAAFQSMRRATEYQAEQQAQLLLQLDEMPPVLEAH